MYIGKTKPWPANLSRSRKKERTEKGADDEETTAPLPRFLMNQRKKDKKKRRNRFLKRQEQQKASVHYSLKLKTNVQSKDKTGFQNVNTTDLKAAKEEKVKTYTCRSQRFVLQKMKWKTRRTLLSRFSSKSPSPSCIFSLLFPHNNTRMQERNSLYLLCFFYSASLAFFVSLCCVFFLPLTLRFSLPFPALSFCVFHPLS
jgi:lipopolysaccharide export LptBFGC system permease protein LptF